MAVLMALATAGCAVGPDFRRPAVPAVSRYTAEPLEAQTASASTVGGNPQRFADGKELSSEWWTLFGSDALNQLVAAALRANPDLQAAEAALRAARTGQTPMYNVSVTTAPS